VFLGPQKKWEPWAEANDVELAEQDNTPGYQPTAEDLEALARMDGCEQSKGGTG